MGRKGDANTPEEIQQKIIEIQEQLKTVTDARKKKG
jgi:hypothetical protein